MTIKEAPIETLKSAAYDLLVQSEQISLQLKEINGEIALRNKTMSDGNMDQGTLTQEQTTAENLDNEVVEPTEEQPLTVGDTAPEAE